jgi:hypothetical protein
MWLEEADVGIVVDQPAASLEFFALVIRPRWRQCPSVSLGRSTLPHYPRQICLLPTERQGRIKRKVHKSMPSAPRMQSEYSSFL